MGNEMELFKQKEGVWYTLEELASLSGISAETLKKGGSPIKKLGLDFEVESEGR